MSAGARRAAHEFENERRAQDRLSARIACISAADIPFTLVSTLGFHCEVWRSAGTLVDASGRRAVDFVLKVSKHPCTPAEVRVLAREHAALRAALDEIVPDATFVITAVNGKPGAVVLAGTCTPWFDLANPTNEQEAVPLLRRHARAADQLRRFTRAARGWLEAEGKLIDLCGAENLVLDRDYGVRYLDSFHVFFYTDLLDIVDPVDEELVRRVAVASDRLAYLEWMVEQVGG